MKIISLLLLSSLAVAHANVTLAPYFQDNAVLQRDKPVPVWGKADPQEEVMVEFRGQKKAAVAEADGRWRVTLDPLTTSAEPAELIVTGKNTLRLANILTGEVWICSGQSNMAWTVKNSKDPDQEIAAANYPLIRHFKTALTATVTPQDTVKGNWEVCSPATAGEFTAVGYYFGRELFQKLNVPIGLLNISYGGTPVESWMDPETLRSSAAYPAIEARLKQDEARYPGRMKLYETRLAAYNAEKAESKKTGAKMTLRPPKPPTGPGTVDRFTHSALYNAMLHPFIPAAVRGAIWFQAEANLFRASEYSQLFPPMIQQWRRDFGDIPFYFVQVANQARESDKTGTRFAFLREGQMSALKLTGTSMAVTADIGEAYNSHFKNKQEVGRRLALIALAQTYDISGEFSGPRVKEITKKGAAYEITFDHAEGLKLTGDGGFDLAGSDKVFQPAKARLENATIVVTSDTVPDPVAVRYGWHNNPTLTIYNAAELPAPGFRSDDWPAPETAEEAGAKEEAAE